MEILPPSTALPTRPTLSGLAVSMLISTLAGAALFAAGCATPYDPPELGSLYNRAAQHHDPDRNPIIVIPGLTGSVLVDEETGRTVWGAFDGDYADPSTPEGARLVALPMAEGVPLDQLRDTVRPDRVLEQVQLRLLGVPLQVKAYVQILTALGAGGYRDQALGLSGAIDYGSDHYTCFQFAFDWRRDLAENARRFQEFIDEKRAYVREETRKRYGTAPEVIRFDVAAHSMGGLLLRYFLRYGGAEPPEEGAEVAVPWTDVLFLFEDHLGLTRDPTFTDNLLYWLLEDPRRAS